MRCWPHTIVNSQTSSSSVIVPPSAAGIFSSKTDLPHIAGKEPKPKLGHYWRAGLGFRV